MRQKTLAAKIGVSNSTVTQWKLSKLAPNQQHLDALRRIVRGLVRVD